MMETKTRKQETDWPMFLCADLRHKLLQEKIQRAQQWLGQSGAAVADLVKECCCEHHRQQNQSR